MDWSQVSVGAIAGSLGTWLLGLSKTWLDHVLEERKQRAIEERTIQAEQRAEAKRDKEQQFEDAERLKADGDTLLMYKTQIKGCTDLSTAASVVGGIHSFFIQRKQYLAIAANRDFLVKYPGDFADQVHYNATNAMKRFPLDELKRDVENLCIEPIPSSMGMA